MVSCSYVSAHVSCFSAEEGEYYVALYAYSSSEPGDLIFNQGDVIHVSKKDGDWWTGEHNNQSGIFPGNYVKKMETQVGHPHCQSYLSHLTEMYFYQSVTFLYIYGGNSPSKQYFLWP